MTDITERLRAAANQIGGSNAVCIGDPAGDVIVLGCHLNAADLIDLLRAERRTLKEKNRRNRE